MLLLDDTFVFGVNEVVGAGMILSLPLRPLAPEPVAVEPGGFFGAIVDSLLNSTAGPEWLFAFFGLRVSTNLKRCVQ